MTAPLVSVICLCYNQSRFVAEAIQSVLQQTYSNIQLIVVDDASTDDSVAVIHRTISSFSEVQFYSLPENVGYCKAFNFGYQYAKGEFIIDLAADDVLLPDRIQEGVAAFANMDETYALNFTDASWMDEQGKHVYFHSNRFAHDSIPQGDVYENLITRYFICSPTMMFRKALMEKLNGYDETLAYEDFDLWIRGSRHFKFFYTPKVLVKKRKVKNSMSAKQFSRADEQRVSTYQVCIKIKQLNRCESERIALQKRILYEVRHCIKMLDFKLMFQYFRLWNQNRKVKYAS